MTDHIEELARTAPHHPPHQLTVGSMRNSTPAFYPIKHLSGRGDSADPWQDVIDRMSENENEDEDDE